MESNFDVIIIGGGPGGYVCAIRASQLGLKTACVESRSTLGGTCLNVGCIPSKSLLNLSQNYYKAKKDFNQQGIEINSIKLNIQKMMTNKDKSVQTLTKGVEFLFKKNKVTYLRGKGVITSKNEVIVEEGGSKNLYKTKNIVIATGSAPTSLPGINIDEKNILSSTGALSLSKVPNELVVIGGGYIGLEMGSVWSRLGTKVTVIEYLDFITPGMDREVSNEFQKILGKQGIKFKLNSKVTSVSSGKDKVIVKYTDNKTKKIETIECDKVLVSVGRKPYTQGLNLAETGVKQDKKGFIEVNKKLQTNLSNIYAIGDVIKGPMLAHKGSEEGVMVAERIAGHSAQINYEIVPNVIYTHPEVASVGRTEEQVKEAGEPYRVGTFPFAASGRALAADDSQGMAKMIACKKTDRILGCHIVGPSAADLVQQVAIAMEFGSSAEDLGMTVFGHPTLSEVVHEAALAVNGNAIHKVNRKQR